MKKFLTGLSLLMVLCVYSISDCVAQEKPSVLKRVKHVAVKAVMLPVYIIGGIGTGAVAGSVIWYHAGGHEKELSEVLKMK